MELISRKEAKAQSLLHYYTGKPCLRGHVSERFISTQNCCACHAERKQAAYYENNKERIAARAVVWNKANPAAVAAMVAQRRAAKLQRTPKWLTKEDKAAIKALYEQCAFTSRVTGEKNHVDHIIPLQGENVSGLHVPANLQILTAAENVTKSNKLLEQFA